MVINRSNCHFFIENEPLAANFISPNYFQDFILHMPTPVLNFKGIGQHLQLVERERKGQRRQMLRNEN